MNKIEYICDICGTSMGLQTLGYYGSALSKRSKRKKKHMETLCHEHYTEKLNQMGINKRIIIVASPVVQANFRLQLFDERKLKKINLEWN